MPKKISELPVTTLETGAELVPVVQGGVTKQSTITKIAAYVKTLFAVSSGSSLVGWIQSGTGAIIRLVQDKLRERVSCKDFGVVMDGVTDDSAAWLMAIANGRSVRMPAGTSLIKSAAVFIALSNFSLKGEGFGISVIKCDATAAFANSAFTFSGCDHFEVSGVTFDQNNNTHFSAAYPLVLLLSSTNFVIIKNEFIHHTYIGLGINSCQSYQVKDNYVSRDATQNSDNYSINASSSVSINKNGVYRNNYCKNAGTFYNGRQLIVDGNTVDGNGFGAGINTSGAGVAGYGINTIVNNICFGGTGVDTNGVYVAGMEIISDNTTISNNYCFSNSGDGIASAGQDNIISGNTCFGNGVGGGAGHRNGIQVSYISASVNANYTQVIGNNCFDGGGSTQLYGYYESNNTLIGISVSGNKFDRNVTAPMFLQGTQGFYETAGWISYTPTVTSTTGTITTLGTVSAQYKQISKMVFWQCSAAITTNGTGGTKISITLPPTPGNVTGGYFFGSGRGQTVSGKMLLCDFTNGTLTAVVANYDDTYPGASGETIIVSGWYEVA